MGGVSGVACLVIAACAWQAEQPAAREDFSPAAIQQAVAQLGDEQFEVRQKASEFLWRAALRAEGALAKAVESDDPEVRYRAAQILDKLRLGITPDTPPEVAALVEAYQKGNPQTKQQMLQQMRQKGLYGTLIVLHERETDPQLKQALFNHLRTDANRLLPRAIAAGDFAEAEKWFAFAQLHEEMLLQMSVVLLVNDKLDGRIAEIQARLQSPMPLPSDARLVAYLLRAAGKLKEAREAAEIAKDAVLLRGLSMELGDWDAVIKQHQVIHSDSPFNRGRETESLCYLAVYEFLAGREAEVDTLLKKLVTRFDEKTDDAWQTGETLLLCERFDLAFDFLKKWRPLAAIELYRHRQEPAEVLTWLKVSPGQDFSRAWFDELPTQPNTRTSWPEARFSLACQLAKLLHFSGQHDDATRLFALLEKLAEEFATTSEQRSFGLLAEAENGAGQGSAADKHLGRALSLPNNVFHLSRMLPKPAGAAAWWWGHLRKRAPGETPEATLKLLRRLLSPGQIVGDAWETLRDEAELAIATLPAGEQGKATLILAETALLQGDAEGARVMLERAAPNYEPAALKLADLLARDKDWEAAAKWYHVAAGPAAEAMEAAPKPDPAAEAPGGGRAVAARNTEIHPAQLLALYLHGFALAEQGEEEAGKGIMLKAQQRLPTASSRHQFALGLQERGLKSQARQQWEIIRRTGPLNSWHTNTAAEHQGNLISGEQPLAAAELWRKLTLQLASTNSTLLDVRGYVDLPVTIHRTRAKALLTEGKSEEALAELTLANKAYPAQTKLVEDFVPLLEKAGLNAEADKLFDAAYAFQAKLCADFPSGASYLNNLAWMAARCGRKLDAALGYATKAVELAPENAGYLDTLAEVHFQRGEKEQAISLMKRCLELEPRRAYFQKQLQRFEAGGGDVPEE